MDKTVKSRGWPLTGAKCNIKPLLFDLEEALSVENTYRPSVLAIQYNVKPGEVTLMSRDGIVHLLRFLKSWFDTPEQVFFVAVSYLDAFIARIKVPEKYLKCLAFACFFIAAREDQLDIPLSTLIYMARCNFTFQDVLRMVDVVTNKLQLGSKITTIGDILRLYIKFLKSCHSTVSEILDEEELLTKLGVLLTDSSCAFFRPSVLAFTLLRFEVDKQLSHSINKKANFGDVIHTLAVMKELQLRCETSAADLVSCSQFASKVIKRYNNHEPCLNNAYLKWNFSPSFRRRDRSSRSTLSVISEKPNGQIKNGRINRKKNRTN
ncbi:cyclin G [Diabrotica undecimpunctata]|uniref:cyclin G n=1 Tax=Diabrotica undecimpunctata TaxID=50387 RepID=UPI003B642532